MTNGNTTPTESPIRAIRVALGLRQQDLADQIGVTQGMVGNYEARRNEISPAVARNLVAVAAKQGLALSLDHVYGLVPLPQASTAGRAVKAVRARRARLIADGEMAGGATA